MAVGCSKAPETHQGLGVTVMGGQPGETLAYTVCVPDRREPGWEPGENRSSKEGRGGEDSPRPGSISWALPQFRGTFCRGREQFCPALRSSSPHHLGLGSLHFSRDIRFIPSSSDASPRGMHSNDRVEGQLAPVRRRQALLPGWGGRRCSPGPASEEMAALTAPPCPSPSSPGAGEAEERPDRNSPHSFERRLTLSPRAGCRGFWAGNSGMPPPQVLHTVGTWSICEGHCSWAWMEPCPVPVTSLLSAPGDTLLRFLQVWNVSVYHQCQPGSETIQLREACWL